MAESNGDRPVGRPTKYIPEYCRQARKACEMGATEADLGEFFGVAVSTIWSWATRHPEFQNAIKTGKSPSDDAMERSLFMRGRGFWIDTEKVFVNKVSTPREGGEGHTEEVVVTRVPVREYYPPDTAAAFIWLKNRRPEFWRDKHEVAVSGKLEHTFTLHIFDDRPELASDSKIIEHEETRKLNGGEKR